MILNTATFLVLALLLSTVILCVLGFTARTARGTALHTVAAVAVFILAILSTSLLTVV